MNNLLKQGFILILGAYLSIVSTVAVDAIINGKHTTNTSTYEFRIPLPEPIIVEKEVIVYVEKEPEETVIEYVPEIQTQPIDYNYDITTPTNLSANDLIQSLGGVRDSMLPYIDAIVSAEQTYGINSLYLLATLGYESGWGQYESGSNNIAGWKIDGHFYNFESKYECVMTVAQGLADNFVPDVGPVITDVAWRYCKDPGYLDTLLQIMNELYNNI